MTYLGIRQVGILNHNLVTSEPVTVFRGYQKSTCAGLLKVISGTRFAEKRQGIRSCRRQASQAGNHEARIPFNHPLNCFGDFFQADHGPGMI